jgi:hypothetical protein
MKAEIGLTGQHELIWGAANEPGALLFRKGESHHILSARPCSITW